MRDIDPIIGIRKFREEFAAEHHYDIRAMSATLRRISDEHGHVTISPAQQPKREIAETIAPMSAEISPPLAPLA